MSLWIIGDIHGYNKELQQIIHKISQRDSEYRLGFLGDYVDRGPDSKDVIDTIIDLHNQGKVKFSLCGNHDLVWAYLCGVDKAGCDDYKNYHEIASWWFVNGLGSCLDSYGIDYSDFDEYPFRLKYSISDKIPESHKSFLKNLTYYWYDDKHFISHAYSFLNKYDNFSNGELYEMLWNRPNFNEYSSLPHNKICVHGHTPTQYINGGYSPIITNKVIMLDTGIARGGKITAMNLETKEYIQND